MSNVTNSSMTHRTLLKTIFAPFAFILAAIYFIIDALVLSILRPVLRRLTHLKLFQLIAQWITSLGPYPTLAVFLIPLLLLEPIKPLSAYLMASGHFVTGVLLLVLGEVLKITIVERIFHIGRPKLMTIPAFAWIFHFVSGWLMWMRALPPWLAIKSRFTDFTRWMRKLN